MEHKYIVCCDFDGVIHGYQSGWKGPSVVTDPPVPGALEWLFLMTQPPQYDRFEIAIYSSRSKEPGGVEAMKAWLRRHIVEHLVGCHPDESTALLDEMGTLMVEKLLTFPTQKPAASMTIDDRAFHFQGTFPTPEWLRTFEPWTKLPPRKLGGRPSRERLDQIREAHNAEPPDLHLEANWSMEAMEDLFAEIDHLNAGSDR